MSAEFVRDDCDNVWFVFANKIQYRRNQSLASKIPGFVSDAEAEQQAILF